MVAHAIELHPLTIQQKAVVGREGDGANAKHGLIAVHHLAADFHRSDGGVEIGRGRVPKLWLGDSDLNSGHGGAASGHLHGLRGQISDRLAGEQQLGFDESLSRGRAFVGDRDLHGDRRGLGRDLRGCDGRAPLADVHGVGFHQPDVAVDAGTGIPAGALVRVVQADGQHVITARLDVGRQVEAERRVTVGPATDKLAFAPHRGIGHGAVDIQIDTPPLVRRQQVQVLAIPHGTRVIQFAGLPTIFLLKRTLDRPVVGEVQFSPGGVIEARLGVGHVRGKVALGPFGQDRRIF